VRVAPGSSVPRASASMSAETTARRPRCGVTPTRGRCAGIPRSARKRGAVVELGRTTTRGLPWAPVARSCSPPPAASRRASDFTVVAVPVAPTRAIRDDPREDSSRFVAGVA
jgi:hypothetical protein